MRSSKGACPPELAAEAAAALEQAGRRALAREANASLDGCSCAPWSSSDAGAPLPRRARSLADDRPPDRLDRDARRQRGGARSGRPPHRGARADGAGAVSLSTATPTTTARASSPAARSTWSTITDDVGRFDALEVLGTVCWWEGDLDEVERLATRAARDRGADRARRSPERRAARAQRRLQRAARAGARPGAARAGDRARGRERQPDDAGLDPARLRPPGGARGQARRRRGARSSEARALFAESGAALTLGRTLNWLGIVVVAAGATSTRAEAILREAIRVLKPLEDRGTLVESQRLLAQVLLDEGRLDEAERFALEARETVGAGGRRRPSSTTRLALGLVRAAQGRDDGGGAAAAGGRRDPAADRLPPSPDRPARGARRVPPRPRREDEAREVEETLRGAARRARRPPCRGS